MIRRDPGLVKRIGAATALEVRATGIPYAFAPCIAVSDSGLRSNRNSRNTLPLLFYCILLVLAHQVCRDPRWGRCYESYSEDHGVVQAMTELIPGLQGDVPPNYAKDFPYVAGK